jgi:hypothetical protein
LGHALLGNIVNACNRRLVSRHKKGALLFGE